MLNTDYRASSSSSSHFNNNYVSSTSSSSSGMKLYESYDKTQLTSELHNIQEPHSIPEYGDMSRYKIGDKLGEGTYGNVHEAIDKITGETVAIKIMKYDYHEGYESNLLDELAYSLTMNHPNIIKYSAVVSDKNEVWGNLNTVKGLVMDKANGSLKSLIKDNFKKNNKNYGSISSNYINMAYQLIDAGVYMSNHNIIHRDLKPGNIVYNKCDKTNDYWLRIIDFGLAINGECYGDKMDDNVYTLPYRAPEIVMIEKIPKLTVHIGVAKYNSKADVWAMGCILYEMRTGSPLFYPFDNGFVSYAARLSIPLALGLQIIWKLGFPEKIKDSYFYEKYSKWMIMLKQAFGNTLKLPNKKHVSVLDDIIGRDNDPELIDLLKGMLEINPEKRLSMKESQKHPFFHDLDIKKSVDNCYKLMDSKQINCRFRSEIFDRNLSFKYMEHGPAKISEIIKVLFRLMFGACIDLEAKNYFQVYFTAIQIFLRYTNETEQNHVKLYNFAQLYAFNALFISFSTIEKRTISISHFIDTEPKIYNKEQMFENQNHMLKTLNFDLLASTPYDVIAGYFNEINDSVKNLASHILTLMSFTPGYYGRINDDNGSYTYKYTKDLPKSCVIVANIMLESTIPKFVDSLNVELCDSLIKECKSYVNENLKELYKTGKLTKESLEKYVNNYEKFKLLHINIVRGLVIGRNNKMDDTMIKLLGDINLSYYNTSNNSSLISGIIPKDMLEAIGTNYDIVVIEGKDVAMKETIKCGMKVLKSGGILYSEYLLFSVVEAYNKRTKQTNLTNIKSEIKSLNINKRNLLKEKNSNKAMYMNQNITVDKYNSNNVELNRSIRNIDHDINTFRSLIKDINNVAAINSINEISKNAELQSYIANYLNPLHKQYGYKTNQYQVVYKYIKVIKK